MKIIKESILEYNEDHIKIANKTSRSAGTTAIGKDGQIRSIVARYVMETSDKDASILDFGAGKDAIQSKVLRDKGFTNITAYDFGSNIKDGIHDPDALSKQYQTVFASNVLNVSSTEQMLRDTINDIWLAVKPGGRALFNYPASPRKADLKTQEVFDIITDVIGIEPVKAGGSNVAPIWEIYK